MSFGLPAHLAPFAVRRSFVAAEHTLAVTLVVIAILVSMVFQSAQPAAVLWPSFVSLLPMLGLFLIVDRLPVVPWSLSYLVVGGLGVYIYSLTMLNQPIPVQNSDGFSFLAVKIPLILVGGVVLGVRAGIVGAIAGYVTATLAVGLAQVEAAVAVPFDIPTLVTLLVTIGVITLVGFNSPRQLWVLPSLQRAAHFEHVAELRYRVEVRAATLMHDTVLNHLASIASSETNVLDPILRQAIQRDVASLTGEEWLAARPETVDGEDRSARHGWQQSGLYAAIQESRVLGLNISTTGDLVSISRLDRETSLAVGLAVKQCLVNVLKHAGTRDAEVAVYHSESEVSVMVVDDGCGFDEATTGADRLGLRSSVRKRIELVGGTVNVWSTPGRGTSIMIKVPAASHYTSSSLETVRERP